MIDFVDRLSEYLSNGELPGEAAQMKMAPGTRVRSSEAKLQAGYNPKLSAVMILIYQKQKDWHSVLIQRPTYPGVHSAQMSLPGGKREENDQNFEDTALRETQEEIGIAQETISVLGELTEVYIPPSNFLVKPFVGLTDRDPVFVREVNEVDQIIEFPLSKLVGSDSVREKDIIFSNGFKLKTPYFDIRDKVVWGATAIMLSEFREILHQIGFDSGR